MIGLGYTTELLLFTAVVLLLSWLYWSKRRTEEFCRGLGIPCATSLPVLGTIYWFGKKGIPATCAEWAGRYGKVYGASEFGGNVVYINDPELIKQILVKQFSSFVNRQETPKDVFGIFDHAVNQLRDDEWRRVRSILSPTFTSGKLRAMVPLVTACGDKLERNCLKVADTGEAIDMMQYFGAYALDAIAATAFGLEVDCLSQPDNEFHRNVQAFNDGAKSVRAMAAMILPGVVTRLLQKVLGVEVFSQAPVRYFTRVVEDALAQRAALGDDAPVDFLQLSLRAEVDSSTLADLQEHGLPRPHKTLSHQEILANAVVFIVAGYDTTMTTLMLASHLLATHPDWQERAAAEVRDVLGEEDELTYEKLQQLKTLENILLETLRRYSVAIRLDRQAGEAVRVGEMTLPKGTIVCMMMSTVHMDPTLFPDPETFNPDRFNDEQVAKSAAFLAFGQGPRECIGRRLALIKAKAALASVLRRCRLVACDKTEIPLTFKTTMTLPRPTRGVWLAVERRE